MSELTKRIADLSPEKHKQLLERLKKKSGNEQSLFIPKQPKDKNRFPLSFAQERLWYLEQLDPGTAVYNFPFTLVFEGRFNAPALEQALNEVIRRQEALRTSFTTLEGQPVQVIAEHISIKLPVIDLCSLSQEEADKETERLVSEIINTPFDLSQAPLFRVTLWRRHEARHALMLCMHHIITDGWSKDVFSKELTTLYAAFSTGKASPLRELEIQYSDFSVWQRQWLTGEVLENHLSYWKPRLANIPRILDLPTDRPRPAVQTFPGDYETFTLSPELAKSLQALSHSSDMTVFMTVLAAFKVLLHRYTGQKDIVVGTPVASRNRPEIEGLIGFFVNNLVLRTNLDGNPTFRELLLRMREVALAGYAHQDIPFEKLVEELQPERDLSTSPFFQVMFIMLKTSPQSQGSQTLANSGQTVSQPILQNNMRSKFDLTLYLEENWDGLLGTFEYNTDLFDAATMSRMAGHLRNLLLAIVANPDLRVSELQMLTERERKQQLVHFNETQSDYPGDESLQDLFEAQVQRTPDRIALVFEKKELTYSELNARSNQLAHYLQSLDVGPDILVGICMERSVDMIIGLLGILKAGGAYVPLDPSYPKERLAFMVEDSQVSVLLTQQKVASELFEHKNNRICLDRDWEMIAKYNNNNPRNEGASENLAYVIYTSGSTGKPKGVAITHKTLVNFLISMGQTPGLSEQDVLLAVTTLSFDIAGLELFLPLILGAKVVLASAEEASDARRLKEVLSESNATVMQATPATWRMLLDVGWRGDPNLAILCGGEALPRDLANRLHENGKALWNMYGPTETTIWSAVQCIEMGDDPISIGKPIANTQLYILDRNMQPVPLGVYGELYIGGAGLSRGYLNRPELTAESFIPDPFSQDPGVRLYRTGDKARFLSAGTIEFSGRLDFQVKIRGFRIELGEIETVCASHPAIQQAIVMPREITNGDVRLVAYIKYDAHDEPTVSELRRFLKDKLPDYMVPSMFVTMDTFPKTPNGKIDRKQLPVPAGMRTDTGLSFEPPDSDMEKLIADVWQQVLGTDSFSVHDNFFDLGGHSLLSMKVLYYLEKRLGIRISPREIIFKNLGQLAALCEEESDSKQHRSSKTITRKLLSRFRASVVK